MITPYLSYGLGRASGNANGILMLLLAITDLKERPYLRVIIYLCTNIIMNICDRLPAHRLLSAQIALFLSCLLQWEALLLCGAILD